MRGASGGSPEDGFARLMGLLRDEPVEATPEQLQSLWPRVRAALQTNREARRSPWVWRLGLATAAAGMAAVTLVVLLSRTPVREGGRSFPQGSVAPQAVASSWRVAAGVLLRADGQGVAAGAALSVGDEVREEVRVQAQGHAVLASAGAVLRLSGGARGVFARQRDGSAQLRLQAGEVVVATRPAGAQRRREMTIVVGDITVRPVGTIFSVAWSRDAPVVAVVEGKVEVSAAGRTVAVARGESLVWGAEPRALPAEREAALQGDMRDALAQVARAETEAETETEIETLAEGVGTIAVGVPADAVPADAEPARPPQAHAMAREPVARERAPRTPIVGNAGSVEAIERLLAAGRAGEAREAARALLASSQGRLQAAALLTLVAESYVRDGQHRDARETYHQIWRRHGQSAIGADALYMVGSLDLEQLSRPDAAAKAFALYLKRYRNGRQRQGAFFMLCRALKQLGRDGEVRAVAARYRAAYPAGEFVEAIGRLAPTSERD